MNFKQQKEEILKRAKKFDACVTEYKKAYKSESTEELLMVVKRNMYWCISEGMLNTEILVEIFGEETLTENYIFVSGEHNLKIEKETYIVTLGNSSANVKTFGNSSANVETFGNSSANVKTFGNSSANVKTFGSSSANVETWDSSSAKTTVEGANSFIRNHNNRTIYIKKDNFNIEVVD